MTTWYKCKELISENDYRQLVVEIELNPDLLFAVNPRGRTLLVETVRYSADECTEALVQAGADINRKNPENGDTALMNAVANRNLKMAYFLLQQGAEISARTKDFDESAFDIAKYKIENNEDKALFELFASYKEKLDDKDLALYHEYRLQMLFETENKK